MYLGASVHNKLSIFIIWPNNSLRERVSLITSARFGKIAFGNHETFLSLNNATPIPVKRRTSKIPVKNKFTLQISAKPYKILP